jgi:PPK2 family polyphosphate:nucleotide phosphotransferase
LIEQASISAFTTLRAARHVEGTGARRSATATGTRTYMARDISTLIHPYLIHHGQNFRLKHHNPRDTRGMKKQDAKELLHQGVGKLAKLQEKLYAQNEWGVLLVFQGMDASGKDGAIKHVMSGINPQGVEVHSFKAPSTEELDHDFLWRTSKVLPERGRIGIFNRSYYEETLVVRVHPELLHRAKLPPKLVTKRIWRDRFDDINAFERYLARNGYLVLKFFLNISKREQRARFLERLDLPEKNWKFSGADLHERDRWRDYMAAYEDMIRHTATPHAPWVVVPADNKKFARIVVAGVVMDALNSLKLRFPEVSDEQRKILRRARTALEGGGR